MKMFPLSVILLTRDESQNIGACLDHLTWADEIILVDSFSTDGTIAAAQAARADIRVFQNKFEDFGQQRNWPLHHTNPKHPWILFVDADERINADCAAAIRQTVSNPGNRVGFFLCYRNIFLGRWIKHCTHFPSWQLRLLKQGFVRFQKEGHGQREVTDGQTGYIKTPFDHLDLSKGVSEWITKHNRYSSQEIDLLLRLQSEPLRLGDLFGNPIERRRCMKRLAARLGGSPLLWFIYVYIISGGFLDGRAGWVYCQLRMTQQIHVKAKLAEAKFLQSSKSHAASAVEFHDQIAGDWEAKYAKVSFIGRERTLKECLNGAQLTGQRWLDAGCGTGRLSRYLASRGCTVTGVDASAEMIRIASNGHSKAVQFQQIADIETMDIEPASFDGVLCISVLEYLADPSAALARFASGLRPGGLLIVSVPNRLSLVRRALSTSFHACGWPAYFQFSRNEYRAAEFASLLKTHHLQVEKNLYLGGPLPQSLQKSAVLGSLIMFVARKSA